MKDILQKAKKQDLIPILKDYYESIGRDKYPPIENYSLDELKKCINLFNIQLQYKK